MDQHATTVDAEAPIAVTLTEWEARYRPATVAVAVLKIGWVAMASRGGRFVCCMSSSVLFSVPLRR